ncbi:teneurin-3-like, partial [Ruditapes philippinarum]|uniref:teneurin-3-like n=1 Tax=Ruditapes philippinarum TaxID=129788 RepID=UPI00295AB286
MVPLLQVSVLIIFLHFEQCTAPGSHGLETCEHHCSEHGHCVKVHASTYKCQCHHGWEGTDCSHEIIASGAYSLSECHAKCSSHGHCVHHHTGHGYICQCDSGWHGSHCTLENTTSTSQLQDHCQGHCGSHGKCVQYNLHTSLFGISTRYSCQCEAGWHGTHCTMQYSSSGTVQCHNTYCVHGVCEHGHYSFSSDHCNCNHGWQGRHCDQQITTAKLTTTTTTTTTTARPTTSSTTSTVAP